MKSDGKKPAQRTPERNVVLVVAAFTIASLMTRAAEAQEIVGVEHWVARDGIKLYVWEKYTKSPAGKRIAVLAHGSATAGKESFDLQVPGKPSYSLMDFLAREGFDVFALDTRGFEETGRPAA